MGECGKNIGCGCDRKPLESTRLTYCSLFYLKFLLIVTLICSVSAILLVESISWDLEPWRRRRGRAVKRRNSERRSWEIQRMRDWTDCNISSSKLQQVAIEKQKKKKKKALNRVDCVSEGKKPAVRSNRSLIFLSWIMGIILLGGYAGEKGSSSHNYCLSYGLFQCTHTPQWNQSQHTLQRIFFPNPCGYKAFVLQLYCVYLGLSEKVKHRISLIILCWLSQSPPNCNHWFHRMSLKVHLCPSTSLFCVCLARLMLDVRKWHQ